MAKKKEPQPKISIKIDSPEFKVDIVMPQDKALKYLKTVYKTVKTGLKVTTKEVE